MGAPKDSLETANRDEVLANLLGQVAAGDQFALGSLYDATSRVVFGLLLRILRDPETAEEVVLDVYTQVWRQSGSYERSRGSPLSWIVTIARSRAIDRLRSGRIEHRGKEPLESAGEIRETAANPEEASLLSERRQLVRTALDALSPEQREVIELAYYSGLSHSEIALRTGQPLGTVKTRTRLGMIRLRDMLGPVLEGQA